MSHNKSRIPDLLKYRGRRLGSGDAECVEEHVLLGRLGAAISNYYGSYAAFRKNPLVDWFIVCYNEETVFWECLRCIRVSTFFAVREILPSRR